MPQGPEPNPIFHPIIGEAISEAQALTGALGATKKKKKIINWSWENVPTAPNDSAAEPGTSTLPYWNGVQWIHPVAGGNPVPHVNPAIAPATLNNNPPPFPGAHWDGWTWQPSDSPPHAAPHNSQPTSHHFWNGWNWEDAASLTQEIQVSPWTQSIHVTGGGAMPDHIPTLAQPVAPEPEPPEYDDEEPFYELDDPEDQDDDGNISEPPSNEVQLMPPHLPAGPKIIVSKQTADPSMRSCQTCNNTHAQDQMKQSADKIWLCPRCYSQFRKCNYCAWTVPEKQFIVKAYVHTYCEECAPKHKSKLHVKQQTTFEPKADVIRVRKEKVWPQISN